MAPRLTVCWLAAAIVAAAMAVQNDDQAVSHRLEDTITDVMMTTGESSVPQAKVPLAAEEVEPLDKVDVGEVTDLLQVEAMAPKSREAHGPSKLSPEDFGRVLEAARQEVLLSRESLPKLPNLGESMKAAAGSAKCACIGGSEYGAVCDDSDFPWCYVKDATECPDAIAEEDKHWSEAACAVPAAAANPAAAAPAAAAPVAGAGGCKCKGGSGYGEVCDDSEFPWCYVQEASACSDAIEECEGASCQHWSEGACTAPSGSTAVIGSQHTTQLQNDVLSNPTSHSGSAAAGCECKGGSGYGEICDASDFPWCYVKTGAACSDAIEECDGASCQHWSETACNKKTPAAVPPPPPAAAASGGQQTTATGVTWQDNGGSGSGCKCVGGSGYGDTCVEDEWPWCYVADQSKCAAPIEECEGGICKFWSEIPCTAGGASGGSKTTSAQHTSMLAANPQAHGGAPASGCKCKGGSGYGNVCEPGDYPWCYVPDGKICADAIEECTDGTCEFWSETACNVQPPPPPAPPSTPVAGGSCTCMGGSGYGDTCVEGDWAWCYVKDGCADAIEECEGGVCKNWSETPCGTSGGEKTVAGQHTSMLKANPEAHTGVSGGKCKCIQGAPEDTCGDPSYPWCYVAAQDSCNDGIEENVLGVTKFWSEVACKSLSVASTSAPAGGEPGCHCKGGDTPGDTCADGDLDNFGMAWCYVPSKDSCKDAIEGICESDHSCSYWSESACKGGGAKESSAIKSVPMTLNAPASMGGTCMCKGGTEPGNICEAGGADTLSWCYIPSKGSCVDAVEGICDSAHSCSYWSEMACHSSVTAASNGKIDVNAQHVALLQAHPELHLGMPGLNCKCLQSEKPQDTCGDADFPWCYVGTKDACSDALEEDVLGTTKYWSEVACRAVDGASHIGGAHVVSPLSNLQTTLPYMYTNQVSGLTTTLQHQQVQNKHAEALAAHQTAALAASMQKLQGEIEALNKKVEGQADTFAARTKIQQVKAELDALVAAVSMHHPAAAAAAPTIIMPQATGALAGGVSQIGGVGDVTHTGSGDVLVHHSAPAPSVLQAAVPVVQAAAPVTTLVHQAAPVVVTAPAAAPVPDNKAIVNVAVNAIASQVSHLADMVTTMTKNLQAPLASMVPAKPMVVPNYYTQAGYSFSGSKLESMVANRAPAEVVAASGPAEEDSTSSMGSFQAKVNKLMAGADVETAAVVAAKPSDQFEENVNSFNTKLAADESVAISDQADQLKAGGDKLADVKADLEKVTAEVNELADSAADNTPQ